MTDTPPVDAQPVEPLTAWDLATIDARHSEVPSPDADCPCGGSHPTICWNCEKWWPCDAKRLLDAARAGDGLRARAWLANPGMSSGDERLVVDLVDALAAARDGLLREALVDMTAAYHHERAHDGKWDRCQHPRCQNARLALEGRGPFALHATATEEQG